MKSRRGHKRPGHEPFQRNGGRPALVALGTALAVAGLYAVAGTFAGPWLVERALDRYGMAGADRVVSHGAIRFNPFTLVAELDSLEMRDETAGVAFAANLVVIDLAASTLTSRRPVASKVVIEQPRLRLGPAAEPIALVTAIHRAALARSRIDLLELTSGTFAVAGTGSAVELERVDLSLTDFDGRSGRDSRFEFDATTAAGATVAGTGLLGPGLERADGQLRASGIALEALAVALGSTSGPAVPVSGNLDFAADVAATALLSAPAIELSNGRLEISAVTLAPATGLTISTDSATAAANLVLTAAPDGVDVTGRIEIDGMDAVVRDTRVMPAQSYRIDNTLALATADTDGFSVSLGGRVRDAGPAALTVRGTREPMTAGRVSLQADSLPAAMLSAYAAEMLGRRLAGGDIDLDLEYAQNGGRVDGALRVVARDLDLAVATNDSGSAASSSVDLAIALLENADRVIEIDLPFAGSAGTARTAVADALTARLATLTATPFDALAPLTDGSDMAAAVPFLPGDAALTDRALASIAGLADVLAERPRLGMRVHGGYDAEVDREALARQQIELHVQLATAGPVAQARPAPVDVDSARVRDVLDEFAGERLAAERVAALAERFACEGPLVPVCEHAYYEQIFDALVANETITPTTLNRLGRFRAQSVIDALRQRGIAGERLVLVTGGSAVETAFGVGLPVELTAATPSPEESARTLPAQIEPTGLAP